jgi:hypothetical protein
MKCGTRLRIRDLADAVRPGWRERMRGVDQHCLRMTHRTWALAAGVPEILIDRQLGHTSPAGEAALRAAWSAVGRSHYTDMNFLTLDAKRSAEAVRRILDRATAAFLEAAGQGRSALRPPEVEKLVGTG